MDNERRVNMFLKNILKAFNPNTKVEVSFDGMTFNYDTVKEVMDSGLMTYSSVSEKSLVIRDNTIFIELEK